MRLSCFGAFHTEPPIIITAILDAKIWNDGDHRCVMGGKLGKIESYLCIAMPILAMAYQAEDTGIQSCMLTPESKSICKLLKVKNKDAVPIVLGIGYEKKGAFQKERTRKPLSQLMRSETMNKPFNFK